MTNIIFLTVVALLAAANVAVRIAIAARAPEGLPRLPQES